MIVRPRVGETAALHIDPLKADGATRTEDGRELHLGSQDLIRFAGYAAGQGFVIAGFAIADPDLTPLNTEEQRELSATMVEILMAHGHNELDAAMRDEFDGLYIIGVELISGDSGLRMDVRRRGFIYTSVVEEAERLLNAAWQTLRLS